MVREVMNPELFVVRPGDPADDTLATLLAMRLHAAPVVDGDGRADGIVSLRDLAGVREGDKVAARMTRPVVTVRDDAGLEAAARTLALEGLHHAPVVDARGRVVGFLSLLDLVRGLLGIPAPHPEGFAHFDDDTGVVWSDPHVLSEAAVEAAPDGPGVLLLIHGGRGLPELIVWAESTHDLRTRVIDLLSEPLPTAQLDDWLERGELRFRVAAIADERRRAEVLARMQPRGTLWHPAAAH